MRDVLGLTRGEETFGQSIAGYLELFRQHDLDGEPGYPVADRELALDSWAADIRAGRLEEFLADDLNGDLIVDRDEVRIRFLRTILRSATQRPGEEALDREEAERRVSEEIATFLDNHDIDGDGRVCA